MLTKYYTITFKKSLELLARKEKKWLGRPFMCSSSSSSKITAARLPPPPQSASNMGFFVKLKYCHMVAASTSSSSSSGDQLSYRARAAPSHVYVFTVLGMSVDESSKIEQI